LAYSNPYDMTTFGVDEIPVAETDNRLFLHHVVIARLDEARAKHAPQLCWQQGVSQGIFEKSEKCMLIKEAEGAR
jgi:hypothetical protein